MDGMAEEDNKKREGTTPAGWSTIILPQAYGTRSDQRGHTRGVMSPCSARQLHTVILLVNTKAQYKQSVLQHTPMFMGRIFLQLSVAKSVTPGHKEVETGRILP